MAVLRPPRARISRVAFSRGVRGVIKASPAEYRFRYALHAILYTLGFYAPWERYTSLSLGATTAWLALATLPARAHWLSFTAASQLVLAAGCVFAFLGAGLRLWGTSYLGASIMQSPAMHGSRVLADGPYRYLRNPLYLGTFLNALALSLLMPPTGALFAVFTIGLLQIRLIGAEEPFLQRTLGAPYRAYCAAVPRLWPSLRPRVPSAGDRPNLLLGFASEIFVIGCAVSFAALGWRYNSLFVIKGVLISLGLSLIARAFIPRPRAEAAVLPEPASLPPEAPGVGRTLP